ncbi:MAG: DUF87 domain-containing protein [Candidatus Krumholzibacteriia bacterium]
MQDYEKLGAFYLGRPVDAASGQTLAEPLLYDAKDLTTHAVILGMTGSGKTGLGVGLIEEAAIDGVPVIAIDPKGDLGNLLLAFPDLRPADFEPWIDPAAAQRKGRTVAEHAAATAAQWREGLAGWDQQPDRIARYVAAADRVIYTPGSRAGTPLAVLRSFAAPTAAVAADPDALRQRVQGAVSGLCTLLDVDADPLRSRDHILLASLLDHAWRDGRDLGLADLIRGIQAPPFEQVGVFDLESFYPQRERLGLAMALNNLLASPSFGVWAEGQPLDIDGLLHAPDGRPRVSVLSIAHLGDTERMFFVTTVLNELVAWMRAQPGTGSLRAILYIDEVFGYAPPSANPPAKEPLLTLLKQARAFGLGVVLASQNPVDLDYKALANAGTWFLGRMQTERDRDRVLAGLDTVAASGGARFDRAWMERALAGLPGRRFLLNNVHEDAPVLFDTRWALSYLSGPLTRQQIQRLTAARPAAPAGAAQLATRAVAQALPTGKKATAAASAATERPPAPAGVVERFLAVSTPAPAEARLMYRPMVWGEACLRYADARAGVDAWQTAHLIAPVPAASASPWEEAREVPEQLLTDAPAAAAAVWAAVPAVLGADKTRVRWGKMLAAHLYRERPLKLWSCQQPRAIAEVGEEEGRFRARLGDLSRESRDLAAEKLRASYAPKLARVQEKIRRSEQRIELERGQVADKKLATAVSVGATVLGALFGRKLTSAGNVSRAGSAARSAGRIAKEKADVERARADLAAAQAQLADLDAEFRQKLAALQAASTEHLALDEVVIRPRKADLSVENLGLIWTPWWVGADGVAVAAFTGEDEGS